MDKTTRSDIKFLYASIGGMFHDRQIPKFQGLPLFFPKQFKDFFSFLKFKDLSTLALNSRLAQEPCT